MFLPREIYYCIFSFSDISTRVSVRLSCKLFNTLLPLKLSNYNERFYAEQCLLDNNFNLFLLAREWKQPILPSYCHSAIKGSCDAFFSYLEKYRLSIPDYDAVLCYDHENKEIAKLYDKYFPDGKLFIDWNTHYSTILIGAVERENYSLIKKASFYTYPLNMEDFDGLDNKFLKFIIRNKSEQFTTEAIIEFDLLDIFLVIKSRNFKTKHLSLAICTRSFKIANYLIDILYPSLSDPP